ncbi:O-fucosyltransferase family protein [Konateibacter massiliensis]|uniref:hypothetical protein n=1 Tax=Konateibacter massiliensis TaxID=2002841 RepID=UPI000C151219|nr:hypothetical protein [Konateibacter massiliensis]
MIIIQPSGGLCNRIRVINSAYELAKKRGDKLTVLWLNNAELNCPFESLFQPVSEIKMINIYSNFNLKKLFLQLSANQRFDNTAIENNKRDGVLNKDFFDSLKKNVFISTWEHFYPSSDYRFFQASDEIQSRIDKITSQFGKNSVGVHIRRTDHTWAIESSKTNNFVTAIEQELAVNPDAKFYVATDDINEENLLREKFPDSIISNQNKTLSRNSVAGMHDALIDLICLSKTTKIFGSYFSSFTDVAADMHQIEKIVIK